MSIIVAILIFGIVVLIHEFGHFYAARKSGILVEEFSIGMGPRLFSFKPGETLYSIKLLPLGGSCQMLGEDESTQTYEGYDEKESSRAFNNKPVWKRITVILAGVFMNFVLAFVVMLIVVSAGTYIDMAVVDEVMPGSGAEQAGLQTGDKIIRANGAKINIPQDLSFELNDSGINSIDLIVLRDGKKIPMTVIPQKQTAEDGYVSYVLGFNKLLKTTPFAKEEEGMQKASFFDCIENAYFTNLFMVKTTFIGLTRLVTRQIGMDQMSGPIGVVQMIGETYDEAMEVSVKATVLTMLNFMSFLSMNLGVMNLLPLPALDGGRFVFLAIEGIRKKPVKRETEGMIHFIGFALLMIFAVFVAYNDVANLIK